MSSPVKGRQPQSQRIYEILRRQILELELPPGAPLSESELARGLGGSRTPIREAIRQLSYEGLVRTLPGRGSFVAEISLTDVIELVEMREALETAAARLAARSPDRAVLSSFEQEFLKFGDHIDAANSPAYYELISRFDNSILKLCANQRLAQALEEIWSQMRRLRRIASSDPSRLGQTVDEHLQIVRAIVSADEAKAGDCVRAHVRRSAENILRRATSRAGQRYLAFEEPK